MDNPHSTNSAEGGPGNVAVLRPGEPRPYRTQPQNEEAEQALLGAILVNNEAIDRIAEFLKPEHFFFPAHSRIFDACLRFREKGHPADPVSLKGHFEADGDLQEIGGADYLVRLASAVVSVVNAEAYGRTIYDLFIRRRLIALGEEMVNEAYRHDLDREPSDQITAAEEQLYQLAELGDFDSGYRAFADVLKEAMDAANTALTRDTHLTGITTGLTEIDAMLGGLQPSDLLILAGRPGMGKSALGTNIAFNAAKKYQETQGSEGAVAAIFSLEMSAEQLATRILSSEAQIPSEKIRKGEIRKKDDFPRLVEASNYINRVPLFIDDTAGLTISQLRTRALRLKRQHRLGLIVVDYLQLMRPSGMQRTENRVQEISEVTRGLKMVAKDLNVPILALSQLSRMVEQREDKRPQLSDLRESGSIEQDADVVMFVYREAYYVEKRQPSMGTPEHAQWIEEMERVNNLADVIVAKQRHGPTGVRSLHFDGALTLFSNLARDDGHHLDH
jgi:replicative DNA helicase